ncbi:MAG: uridine phosphorylase [Actinomycetota bacterium]|nr:uridine phosphorylase [Actinomycetota bacterium]
MQYPLTPGKWREASVTGPESFIGAALKAGWDPGPVPVATVFTYDPTLTAHLRSQPDRFSDAPNLAGNGASFATGPTRAPIWVSCTGVGPAACTMELENLRFLGCRRFVSIGIAGSLDPALRVGDLVLLTSALRDDGLSQHYLEPARYSSPSASLTDRLRSALNAAGETFVEGSTWTSPTPNRSTAREIADYRAEGILTVEMEAAALFAVGEALDVEVASAVVVSDEVAPDGMHSDYMRSIPRLFALLETVLRMLAAAPQ